MRLFRSATLIFVAVVAAAGCDRSYHPQYLDRPAPQFAINDGVQSFDLSKYRGHVVLVNLWASWCAPCVEELPSLLALQHRNPQITIVAVSMDQDDTAYRNFLTRHSVDLLSVRDPSGHINQLYGTRQIPETYVIDKQGILRRKYVNAQNWTSPEIGKYLQDLVAAP